ncbi:MAG: hypothetical protein JNM66_00785 [Bryobacterales bacterium]|nr:hypothetical protein [Bryobacterales bacterium]
MEYRRLGRTNAGLIPRFCRTYGDACPLVLASFRNELHRPVLYQIGAGS